MVDAATQTMKLKGGIRGGAEFELELRPAKPLVVFGENGVSRKAADPTAASHYLTFTRLRAQGRLRLEEQVWRVEGQAWMDHEISSSQLGVDQEGWDWACLQLRDGREIMVYRLRGRDGSTSPFSTLAWIDEQGRVTPQAAADFSWKPQGVWTSRDTGARYPLPVRLECRDPETGAAAVFDLEPLALAQELTGTVGGVAYWEGACRVRDGEGREVGSAFMELTGYAGDLSARFR
jgi:predicted secreted hydrolase